MDAASKVGDLRKAVALQESGHLHAAHAVMADADDRRIAVHIHVTRRHRMHRHRRCAVDMASLEFPRLAHVVLVWLWVRWIGEPFSQLRCGHLLHGVFQNLKCEGATMSRSGLTLGSNSLTVSYFRSDVRVISSADITGASPITARIRPPTLICFRNASGSMGSEPEITITSYGAQGWEGGATENAVGNSNGAPLPSATSTLITP